ncbi:MAG: hypothetical protein ACJAVZ_001793 [Afipia broomeae]|jgi:hypothetical protein|nr:MAG: hypothetical protein EKK35_14210 [Bradyrhizobiaceae bacterium]
MTLILLALSLSVALCVIAFNFAIYALPFMVGLAAFRYIYAIDAGFAMSSFAALGAAFLSVAFTVGVLAIARNSVLRFAALTIFAAPAAVAGFALAHGILGSAINSAIALQFLSVLSGGGIGIASMMNINAFSAGVLSR